ncbi:MAG: hypothetical protein ABSB88_05965 [Bryobacteraceae bacterium]|jgi:hypothetical protein
MKRLFVITVALVLAALCGFAQVTVSTAVEPALNAPARFGVSAAVSATLPPTWLDGWDEGRNSVSIRYGSGRTILGGVARNFVDFLPGLSLVGDVQAGTTGGRGVILYGAAVATDLGRGYSVTYGAHINKIAGRPMYPSAYVSIGYTFGGWR